MRSAAVGHLDGDCPGRADLRDRRVREAPQRPHADGDGFRPDDAAAAEPLPLGIFGSIARLIDSTYTFGLVESTKNINLVGQSDDVFIHIVAKTDIVGRARST